MRRIIAILDVDNNYSERLADYFNEHNQNNLRAVAFQSIEDIQKAISEYDIQILLVAEELDEILLERFNRTEISGLKIVLSEDGFIRGSSSGNGMYKYQPADSLARYVMKVFSEQGSRNLIRVSNGRSSMYGIYSPINRCGKTMLAVTLGLSLAQKEKTILISLDEYEGIMKSMAKEHEADLSDVIYGFRQNDFSWTRLAQSVYRFGGLDYIPPVRYAQDLQEISLEDLKNLVAKITSDGGYENIVIDFGCYGKQVIEFIEMCEKLFIPVIDDVAGALKLEEFMNQLVTSGHGDMKEKIIEVNMPEPDKKMKLPRCEEDFIHGKLYECARDLCKTAE